MVLVAKLVDAADCGSAERNLIRVRLPSFTLISARSSNGSGYLPLTQEMMQFKSATGDEHKLYNKII